MVVEENQVANQVTPVRMIREQFVFLVPGGLVLQIFWIIGICWVIGHSPLVSSFKPLKRQLLMARLDHATKLEGGN